ncbi:MAG: hypothetical protein FJ333_02305 [Sphingomonadales bacterium]|nr:hypothetical protein [Sphingomonadales bacterium]
MAFEIIPWFDKQGMKHFQCIIPIDGHTCAFFAPMRQRAMAQSQFMGALPIGAIKFILTYCYWLKKLLAQNFVNFFQLKFFVGWWQPINKRPGF